MDRRHGILGRVPIAEAHPAAHLDEGGEPGEHDVDLALIQVPDVDLRVHGRIGSLYLQGGQLPVPEVVEPPEILVHLFRGIFASHGSPGGKVPFAQQEQEPLFLPGRQGDDLLQTGAVVPAIFKGAFAPAALHGLGISLRAVAADERISKTVESVRMEVGGEELVSVLLVVEVVFDDPVLVPAAGGVQAHLEILVVHGHVVEAELRVGIDGQSPGPIAHVFQSHVPYLHWVVHGHEQGLGGVDAPIGAQILHVSQPVSAGEMLLWLAHRLPGDGPIVPRVLVPEIHVVARSVHGHAVGPKAGNAMVFGALINEVSARRMVEYAIHVLGADIVGP